MRVLVDSHALIWWFAGSERLSMKARHAMEDETNEVLVSAASAWEITTKHRIGRLPEAALLAEDIKGAVAGQGFEELAITLQDASRAGRLAGALRDPFDRMLIAQAQSHDLVLISIETHFDAYSVRRLW